MDYQQIQSYLDQLQEWAETASLEWNKFIQDQQIRNSEITALDEELNQIRTNIIAIRSKSPDSSELVEDVAKLKSQAEQFYQEWLELERVNNNSSIPIGGHKLPPLPYDYDALEPYISAQIMKLHYTKHHQSYVDGLNKAEIKMKEARQKNDFDLIRHWEREAAFHGAGHYLHTIFWNNMHPKGGGEPKKELRKQIEKDFGSFENFKQHFSNAAKHVEGVGWAILVWAPRAHRLEILQAEKHQYLSQWDVIPLLVLDVWEHAYYLQYQTEKEKYIENWWNVVHWSHVEERYQVAKEVKWKPF